MKIFLDKHIPISYCECIKKSFQMKGYFVYHYTEMFVSSERDDDDWLLHLSQEGDWIAITADLNIYRTPHRKRYWKEANVQTFFLPKGYTGLGSMFMLTNLMCWINKIIKIAENKNSERGYYITKHGVFYNINTVTKRNAPR